MEKEAICDLGPGKEMDYLKILRALNEIEFSVGKNLLIDFLYGSMKNESVKKNELFLLHNFGALKKYSLIEIREMVDNLIANSMIEVSSLIGNKFAHVLGITSKGNSELINPLLNKKKMNGLDIKKTEISDEERVLFKELDFFLSEFNDGQKKSIISQKKNILCIAGAGSGKTTVLTKRIEFLVKYKSINPSKILAITFTRKARQEMERRLASLGVSGVSVETFNSFSEKILKKYGNLIYDMPTRVMSYSDKILAISLALENIGLNMNSATGKYFSESQRNNKEQHQLSAIFMNDCFSILEYFKSKNQPLYDFSIDVDNSKDIETAKVISSVCRDLESHMQIQGLRDYTDQILDTINFFKKNKDAIPEFDYILIDEYQDVNAMQVELIDLLVSKNPQVNLFAVGDPRQSIFGWRGSDIKYILKFEEKYPDCEIIHLVKNYRSSRKIVEFMNHSIKSMKVPDLESSNSKEAEIKLLDFDSEEAEHYFVLKRIQDLLKNVGGEEIFVLARTNRQLNELSNKLKSVNISHVLRTDELKKPVLANKGDITLATIHAIKGLEAKIVFVIGCNELNFPCKASDHPVIEVVKIDMQEYDKEEEEKRLFYVAISRAKEKLFLSYSGKKPTYFINSEMMAMVRGF
ncbi:MAG: exodeoxyribonuclease V subunit gamma [Nanoarchaeota archaeon]|nr:exodeoxyribonuclease V subunit gamma [Nanoarchaeota archaeon]